ncbi:unnamed protein product, partial [Tetraodon nigroviridis]
LPGGAGGASQKADGAPRRSRSAAGRESDRGNGTLPHQRLHLRLRPVLPGQEHGQEAPGLPGGLQTLLRPSAGAALGPRFPSTPASSDSIANGWRKANARGGGAW